MSPRQSSPLPESSPAGQKPLVERRRPHLAWLLGLALLLPACAKQPWNVLLVTLDTTRADFIGCYGKESARTPNLDRLAAQGFLFERAYSSNPVTQAAHSTILTGVYPMAHGVRDNGLFKLPAGRDTLAELLKAHGFATGAAVGGFPLTVELGTGQGFDFYDDDLTADRLDYRGRPDQRQHATWYDERPASHVNDAILPWLRKRDGDPFFVWLHYWDPHEPHIAPAPYSQLFAHDPYQGEIAYADDSLGTILRYLEKTGELERTLIVITADHGESRHEHSEVTHAFLAFDTTLHVPLIVRVPGRAGGSRIAERVGTVDIVPTILDLLDFKAPPSLQGRSLVPLMDKDRDGGDRRPYYSESLSPRLSHGFGELRVLYQGPWKYIHGPRPELYNLADDPRERHEVSAEHHEVSRGLETALQAFLDDHASVDAADAAFEADNDTRQRLAALGYLSTTGDSPGTVAETLSSEGIPPQDRVGDINLMQRLRRELGAGSFHRARRTAERLLELAPDNPFYRAKLASALLGMGQVEDAARIAEQSAVVSAANLGDFLTVAKALFDGDEQHRGLELARRLVTAQETADGLVELARMLLTTGDGSGFETTIARARELDGDHREASLELARYLTGERLIEQAEHELQRLLATYPTDVRGHLAYAQLLRASTRSDEAVARLERVLRLGPSFCEAHLERISLLAEMGRGGDAREALEELLDHCEDRETRARAAALVQSTDPALG